MGGLWLQNVERPRSGSTLSEAAKPHVRNIPDGTRHLRKHNILVWHRLYAPLLMLSIATLRAQSHPAVTVNHSEPPSKARIRLFQTESHLGSRVSCSGRPRYDHEFTMFGDLLTKSKRAEGLVSPLVVDDVEVIMEYGSHSSILNYSPPS